MTDANDDSSKSILSKLLAGSTIVLIGNILNQGLGFGGSVLVARFLGPTVFGTVSLGLLVMTVFGALGTLSMDTGLSRYIPRSDTTDDTRGIIKTGFIVPVPLSTFIGLLLYLNSNWIATELFADPTLKTELQVFSLGIPVYVVAKCFAGIIRGCESTRAKVLIENIAQPVTKLALIIVAIVIGAEALGVAVAYVAAFGMTGGLSYIWLRSHLRTPFQGDLHEFSELYRYSTPLVITTLMTISFSKIDRAFLGYYTSTATVGIYEAVYQLGSLLLVVITAFNFLFFPRFSQLDANGQMEQMRIVFQTTTKWLITATLPIFLAMILFPNFLIRITYGSEFLSGSIILVIISIGIFSHVISGLNRSAMKAIGSTKQVTYGTTIAFAGNIILNFALVPRYGGVGAAIATAISYFIWNIFYIILIYSKLSIIPIQIRPLINLIIVIIIYMIIFVLGVGFIPGSSLLGVVVFGIVISISYPILLYSLNIIGESEREIATELFSRALQK